MPRRTAVDLASIADLGNLAQAFWRAAAGKRNRPEVQAFAARLDHELASLRAEINAGEVSLGTFRAFTIRDPKRRTIHAPCFRDRVLHHALIARIGDALDRSLVDDTFACRVGKGTWAAVCRARHHLRRHPWYAQVDVSAYFASIDHQILKEQLRRRLKGSAVIALCDRIVDAYAAAPGRGLPIGALTSQHFANLYLASLDRFILERSGGRGMVRYMDDVVWWGRAKTTMRAAVDEVIAFAADRLRLQIKPAWRLQRSRQGVSFCGYRILPSSLRLSQRRRRRYRRGRQRWEAAHRFGLIDGRTLQAGFASIRAITAGADAAAWRRRELCLRPAPEV